MKKSRILLPLLALVLGVGLAFATQTSEVPENNAEATETFYWFQSGVYSGVQATVPTRQDATGCNGSGALCEEGYRQDQLVNGNPLQGVISGQSPSAVIQQP